jgi:hypothetical protein
VGCVWFARGAPGVYMCGWLMWWLQQDWKPAFRRCSSQGLGGREEVLRYGWLGVVNVVHPPAPLLAVVCEGCMLKGGLKGEGSAAMQHPSCHKSPPPPSIHPLRYLRNGVDLGTAFTGVGPEVGGTLVPAVCLGSTAGGRPVRVTLVPPPVRQFSPVLLHPQLVLRSNGAAVCLGKPPALGAWACGLALGGVGVSIPFAPSSSPRAPTPCVVLCQLLVPPLSSPGVPPFPSPLPPAGPVPECHQCHQWRASALSRLPSGAWPWQGIRGWELEAWLPFRSGWRGLPPGTTLL